MTNDAKEFAGRFARICNIAPPPYSVVDKAGEEYLALHVGTANKVYEEGLARTNSELESSNAFANRAFLKRKRPANWLNSSECQILQGLLTESLTIGKASLESDFHAKSIPFLGGEERRIINDTNHVVFGRRGAGKSTLVLHSCFRARTGNVPFAWIAMQQYQGRDDLLVIPQVLLEIVQALSSCASSFSQDMERLRDIALTMEEQGPDLSFADIRLALPHVARHLLPLVQARGRLFLFIDDLHLLHPSVQPLFLAALYSFARGNNIYLKITAIENLTRLYDHQEQVGFQTPGDAQVIRLDYNLVNPGAAYKHISRILESYVTYVGIPSIKSLSAGKKVLERLTWACAGVPRDALYIFNNAISKAISAGRTRVSVTDINMAAADSMIEKERYICDDVEDGMSVVHRIIEDLKTFCLKEIKCNAFLVHIDVSNPKYGLIQKVSDLRFIHVLHPGITPERAGEKYQVFLLDYAFYTGFRKTPSVKEVVSKPEMPPAKQLRKLKRYDYEHRLTVP
ncbi:MAG TPA: ATP-binding protein [Phycisphaerae bacterium]|nr:ATP-binding protein [Phycisphaerae bacterium]